MRLNSLVVTIVCLHLFLVKPFCHCTQSYFETLVGYQGQTYSLDTPKTYQADRKSACSHLCLVEFQGNCTFFSHNEDTKTCEIFSEKWKNSLAVPSQSWSITHKVRDLHLELNGIHDHYKYAVSLQGDAKYTSIDGCTALYMDGSGDFADVSPVPQISSRSFTMGASVRFAAINRFHGILQDWSSPYQFRMYVTNANKVVMNLRKTLPNASDLLYITSSEVVTANKWYDIAFTRNFESGAYALYMNSVKVASGTLPAKTAHMINNHLSWEIGYKKDSMDNILQGYIRNVFVSFGVLPVHDIETLLPPPPGIS